MLTQSKAFDIQEPARIHGRVHQLLLEDIPCMVGCGKGDPVNVSGSLRDAVPRILAKHEHVRGVDNRDKATRTQLVSGVRERFSTLFRECQAEKQLRYLLASWQPDQGRDLAFRIEEISQGANGSPGCTLKADWVRSLSQRQSRNLREMARFQQQAPEDDSPFVEDWESSKGVDLVEICCSNASGLNHEVRKTSGKAYRVAAMNGPHQQHQGSVAEGAYF